MPRPRRAPLAKPLPAALAALALAAASALAADVVVLRDGTMLEGTALAMDREDLRFRVDDTRRLIARDEIRSIHLDATIDEVRAALGHDQPDDDDPPAHHPGEIVQVGPLEITLRQPAIERVHLVDLMGEPYQSRRRVLTLRFDVRNIQDYGALRVAASGSMAGELVTVLDHDGRPIPRADFRAGSRLRDALRDGREIDPGETVSHLEAFAQPPDDAHHLTCVLDLRRFGGDGTVRFRFPRP